MPTGRVDLKLDFEKLTSSCTPLISEQPIARRPETVTSQHLNRGKKIPAFIIKVTKIIFVE